MDAKVIVRKPFSIIELPLFLWMFAQVIAGNVFTDLVLFRTCRMLYGQKNDNCSLLHTNSSSAIAMDVQHEIQSHISNVVIVKSVITTLIPAFVGLFLGTWSDKYGRKSLMLLSYVGPSLTFLSLTILCNYDMNTMLLILVFLPFALGGGFSSLILSSLCYITDTVEPEKRAMRLVWIEASIGIGSLIGIFTGPALFKCCGYAAVFGTATATSILAGIYVLFYVRETSATPEKPKYLQIFNIFLVKDLLMTLFRKRAGFNRTIVWACTLCLVINMMILEGDVSIGFLFTSARLGWDVSDFANYTAVAAVCSALGAILGTKLLRGYLGLSEMLIVMITNIFNVSNQLIKAFTWQSWNLYFAAVIGMFSGVFSPMMRSVLSRTIPSHEVGKIFSVTVFVEMVAAFIASPLYNLIYTQYLPPFYPCPVWIMSASFIVIITAICYFIRVSEQFYRNIEYSSQQNNSQSIERE